MTNKPLAQTVKQLFELRKQNGKYDQAFDVILSPMELLSQEFLDTLDPAGSYHSSVLPWTPSPWGRAFWVEQGDDHTRLEVKFKAMERFRDMMAQFGLWQQSVLY